MAYKFFGMVALSLFLSIVTFSGEIAQERKEAPNGPGLGGVYEFVSQTVEIKKPQPVSSIRSAPEWVGMWQFQSGHFSQLLMKAKRDTFFSSDSRSNLGFDAFGGSYEFISPGTLLLHLKFSVNPFDVDRGIKLQYEVNEKEIRLIETLQPKVEDLREGKITTILRKKTGGWKP
jgi:hypothetical protein